MKRVAIIDYQLGNLYSVKQACLFLGAEAFITSNKDEILKADCAILPGVGAFGDAMKNLENLDLVSPIKDFIDSGKSFMGVCLGLQLLFSESEEFGSYKGLNVIPGSIKRFPELSTDNKKIKIPQIQWNQIYKRIDCSWETTPLRNCTPGDYMYFVHSFYVSPESDKYVLSETNYEGLNYCSSIVRENVFACQFHPEKSGLHGVQIYKNWLAKN